MGWILDLALILFILLSIFLGMRRGLIGSLVKLLNGVLRLILSVVLARPLVSLLSLTSISERLFDSYHVRFSSLSNRFNVNLVGMNQEKLNAFTAEALADADIPKIFRSFFLDVFNISPETISARESVTIADMMSATLVNITLLIFSFLFLTLLLWLVSKLIVRWSKGNTKKTTIFAKTNKWLGASFGLLKSVLIVFVIFIVISFLSGFGFMKSVVLYIESSFIAKWLYRLSLFLINSSFDLKEMLKSWI